MFQLYLHLSRTTRLSRYQKKHSPTQHLLWLSIAPYLLHPSTTICDILPAHSMRLTVFFRNLCPSSLWTTFRPDTLHFILHTFLTQSLSSFRITCPYHRNLFCCSTEIMSSTPSLSLNPLLRILSCRFTPYIHVTISSLPTEVPPHWPTVLSVEPLVHCVVCLSVCLSSSVCRL